MVSIYPFRALRPPAEHVAYVASVPYDTVNTEEASRLAEGEPKSFLRVVRAEIDLPDPLRVSAEAAHARARENLAEFRRRGWLVQDAEPGLYLYRLSWRGRSQTGLVACCAAKDYVEGRIKKHEKTRLDKEEDRMKLTLALRAHVGPVFLTYPDQPEVDAIVNKAEQAARLFDFVAPDGVRHEGWRVPEPDRLVQAFSSVPALYVADGHHRTAAAARVAEVLGPDAVEAQGFLAVIFPATQLRVLPYNRLVADLNGHEPARLLEKVAERFFVQESSDGEPAKAGQIDMFLRGSWHRLQPLGPPPADPVAALDVSRLQDGILAPLLGIEDPRTDTRVRFVGGIRGIDYLEKKVRAGEAAVAFSLFPVSVQSIVAVADRGLIMAPKCTWFEPKLRSGLFVHTF